MKCIEELVNEIYYSSQIPFQLTVDEIGQYESPKFQYDGNYIEELFEFNNTKCCIKINAAFSVTINLLKFCILEKLSRIFLQKQNIISLLLNGKSVEEDIIKSSLPMIMDKFTLINIYVENYREEILSYIKQCYLESEIEVISYGKRILMFGRFEEVLEHLNSIKETIGSFVSGKCYICYCEVENYSELIKCFNDTSYKIDLAIKYNIMESILDSNKLLLEGIIDSVDQKMKEQIFDKFKYGISKLDREMIKTIDVFFRCGLNISEAAKELYIHRNTLIYRLDKIQKYLYYDIREFNNAILVKIVLFIWREKKDENI